MKEIDQAIEYVEGLLEEYQNPMSYCEAEYYERCRAKADVLEDVLQTLQTIKKGAQ